MGQRNIPNFFNQLGTELMLKEKHKPKDSFWASDCDKGILDIYLKFKDIPETNPPELPSKIVMLTGKKIEETVVDLCSKSKSIKVIKPEKGEQFRVDMKRKGIKITGYIDMVIKEKQITDKGKQKSTLVPTEIKSCYGFASSKYEKGEGQLHHLKQLAVYMDYMDVDKGYLLYVARDTGGMWIMELLRDEEGVFKGGGHTFKIVDEYVRWSDLYYKYIINDIEPKNDYLYKTPINDIDWNTTSKTDISKARTGKAVIGDWQVKYSSYKNYVIQKEAERFKKNPSTYLGYSDLEKAQICQMTQGYSSKK